MRSTLLRSWCGLVWSWVLLAGTASATPDSPPSAAGFAVAPDLVVTSARVVQGSSRIVLQGSDGMPLEARPLRIDAASGLALLKVTNGTLVPLPVGKHLSAGPIQCACFPDRSVFAPEARLVAGQVTLTGNAWNASLEQHPRLAGSPLLRDGRIVGVIAGAMPAEASRLPVVSLDQIRALIGDQTRPVDAPADTAAAMVQITVQ